MADPRSKELNMLDGPILPRILQFTLPLAATGMLQLLFNAADVIVVGKFSGSIALAAVGATSTLVNLIVNTFIGISVGVNILVARRIGCHDAGAASPAQATAPSRSARCSGCLSWPSACSSAARCSNGSRRRRTFWKSRRSI